MVVLTEISQECNSSSSSSSSSSPYHYDYDVFLSFRGTDTRFSFTDHLHKALLDATIDTFLDDAEIHTGEDLKPELENAIKSSRASIIVLSKNYASSTWCLDELALILEQRRTSKHIVFPVFYHVKPTDVRKQQGSFGDAMGKHKQKMEAETNAEKKSQWAQKMEKWEKALTQVADIKGEEANGTRRETILIEGIIKEISGRLDLHKRSKIPHIIGMESSIRKITSFLKDESCQNTEILTIWGMAGIGKTYLANYVFKLHYHDFERSCFLEDIERKCIQPDGLLDLQKQLLKDIRDGSWMEIHNTDVGTFKIEKTLLRKRTLLVLDGIDKYEQLDALLGTKGLHRGSKIIVTSKSELLTEKCRLFETRVPPSHKKHLLNGLNEKESLQLISWHAFGRNEPKEDDKKEIIRVVKYCKGHPLALKVLGSSVRSEDATWEDILESLGKNDIYPDIQKVLKISFDSLPSDNDRDMFKYIACFFVGEDRKFTEEILKSCKICKSSGIKILINRCLVTVGSSNILMMHQLLQDMGRDIVHQEYPKKPWKRSLLWRHEECVNVLQKRQGTMLIRGLALDMKTFDNGTSCESYSTNMRKFEVRSLQSLNWAHILLSLIWGWVLGTHSSFRNSKGGFETLAFSKMCDLRLLRLNYVQLNGSYQNIPAGLRWLCMHGFPLSYIPSDLQMEDMVALDMSNSKLQRLWKKPTLLRSLKFLNLSSCCELVSLGHFSGLPLLERLMLVGCTSLVEMLFEHGIFSAYLKGHEVPKWFTQRSKGSSFTLKSSVKNGKVRGLNVCIVNMISRTTEVGPSRIEIRNLTKNRTWTYQPMTYVIPENDELEDGDEVVVWLSHWMFGNNEFEDGDEVSVHYSVKFRYGYDGYDLCYDDEGPDYAHVREYGISLVYDDDGSQKEDPLAHYKSWSHIIGGDLSAAEVSSNHYLLKHWRN